MTFRFGLLIGFGAGYYLGSKAGRERYEQLRGLIDRVAPAQRVQAVIELAQDRWHAGAHHHPHHQSAVVPPSPN